MISHNNMKEGNVQFIPSNPPSIPSLDRYLGCILGGAIGDALGYPIEFDKLTEIVTQYGKSGITELQIDRKEGASLISDDTQMTLFTIDGILSSFCSQFPAPDRWPHHFPKGFEASYLSWLYTQTRFSDIPKTVLNYGLKNNYDYHMDAPELFNNRAPGQTCLTALMSLAKGEPVRNDSKGCGGVMRVAPIGLFYPGDNDSAYLVAAQAANITHKHQTSDEASGALASIVSLIVDGKSIRQAVRQTLTILKNKEYTNGETSAALEHALALADAKTPVRESIAELGEGWVTEEALAIAVYCALTAKSFSQGVIHAVNHDGDSDSTGAICGNILGALYGVKEIPASWLGKLELREYIERLTYILHCVTYIKAIGLFEFERRKLEFADIYLKD